MYGYYILGIVIWVTIALWPAFRARNKGYSFLLFFLISLAFWWITLFVTFFLKDKTAVATAESDE
jgi:hypothetical protein